MNEAKKKFEGIITAAGSSIRMNRWKPEVKINGIPIIIHSINSMIRFCDKVIVVGGFNYSELQKLIENYLLSTSGRKENIRLIKNKNFINGMLSSVKCGLSFVSENTDGVFTLPGDMPLVGENTYSKLIYEFEDNNYDVFLPGVIIHSQGENKGQKIKKGHPVLIRQQIVKKIIENEQEIILRDILKKQKQKLCIVEDEGICLDIDNKTDLIKANSYFNKYLLKKETASD